MQSVRDFLSGLALVQQKRGAALSEAHFKVYESSAQQSFDQQSCLQR